MQLPQAQNVFRFQCDQCKLNSRGAGTEIGGVVGLSLVRASFKRAQLAHVITQAQAGKHLKDALASVTHKPTCRTVSLGGTRK